jgi:hypothetical protein
VLAVAAAECTARLNAHYESCADFPCLRFHDREKWDAAQGIIGSSADHQAMTIADTAVRTSA